MCVSCVPPPRDAERPRERRGHRRAHLGAARRRVTGTPPRRAAGTPHRPPAGNRDPAAQPGPPLLPAENNRGTFFWRPPPIPESSRDPPPPLGAASAPSPHGEKGLLSPRRVGPRLCAPHAVQTPPSRRTMRLHSPPRTMETPVLRPENNSEPLPHSTPSHPRERRPPSFPPPEPLSPPLLLLRTTGTPPFPPENRAPPVPENNESPFPHPEQ